MAPLILDGNTLGEKHRSYNKLIAEALNNKQPAVPIEESEDDIRNLMNIEIACKNRNVDYILEVFKSEDQLYVSKAIKCSTWLIKDPQYAHIINPELLYTQFYQQMTSKSFAKLMLHIRLHLKDEKRVETFYNYIKENNLESAFKWLQHCSISFVENEVAKYSYKIPDYIILRLFEKSFSIFEICTRKGFNGYTYRIIEGSQFLAVKYPNKYLDFLESLDNNFYCNFNEKTTKILMKKCPQRIIDKFELYGQRLHLATFAKYLQSRGNIKVIDFLLKHGKSEKTRWIYLSKNIQHFIKNMPKENRFEFVKKVFIDKEISGNREILEDTCMPIYKCAYLCASQCNISQTTNSYEWYKFAPFDEAFTDLRKLIRAESTPAVRTSMFQVLISCAGHNMQHIHTVLQYYHDKHINEPFKFKIQFVNSVISRIVTHKLDDKTWNILNQLFHSMEVYIDSGNNVQSCVKSIIIRNTIRNEEIPEIIKSKFVFDTLKKIQRKLSKEEKEALFNFLQNIILMKASNLNLSIETEFNKAVTLCQQLLNLIKDWDKELSDHPHALERVKELLKIKKNKNWDRDMSSLYNTKRSWRKSMFEESITLSATEQVFLNALKHDPGLLSRYENEVAAICFKDSVSLRHLLSKLRIYWSHTLAIHWRTTYLRRLNQPDGHKALIDGLATMLSKTEINELLNKYAPSENKIDWNGPDQLELSLRKQISKNIHKARPLAPLEGILQYAKGDYLQYALPSLNAILSQLSPYRGRLYIPMLLDAPVSLQKFGIRYAFKKLEFKELMPKISEIWKSTKNSSIRTVLFLQTFSMLCKEKKTAHLKDVWEILNTLIDNLTADEDKLIYKKLGAISDIPDSIKPILFMKSYTFLMSLPAKCNCESIIRSMQNNATDIMKSLDDNFVVNIMLKDINETITQERNIYDKARLLSSFLLSPEDDKTQIQRYEKALAPILSNFLPLWQNVYEAKYRIKNNIECILERLTNDMDTYTFEKKTNIPFITFNLIMTMLEKHLSYQKDYVLLTIWKLTTTFVKLLKANSYVISHSEREHDEDMTDDEKDKMYNKTHKLIAPEFANLCVQYLKDDLNRFGMSIYTLFSTALVDFFHSYLPSTMFNFEHKTEYIKYFLQHRDEREISLVVLNFLACDIQHLDTDTEKQKLEEIRNVVLAHPSDEVKMHFYRLFANIPPFVTTTISNKEERA